MLSLVKVQVSEDYLEGLEFSETDCESQDGPC